MGQVYFALLYELLMAVVDSFESVESRRELIEKQKEKYKSMVVEAGILASTVIWLVYLLMNIFELLQDPFIFKKPELIQQKVWESFVIWAIAVITLYPLASYLGSRLGERAARKILEKRKVSRQERADFVRKLALSKGIVVRSVGDRLEIKDLSPEGEDPIEIISEMKQTLDLLMKHYGLMKGELVSVTIRTGSPSLGRIVRKWFESEFRDASPTIIVMVDKSLGNRVSVDVSFG